MDGGTSSDESGDGKRRASQFGGWVSSGGGRKCFRLEHAEAWSGGTPEGSLEQVLVQFALRSVDDAVELGWLIGFERLSIGASLAWASEDDSRFLVVSAAVHGFVGCSRSAVWKVKVLRLSARSYRSAVST